MLARQQQSMPVESGSMTAVVRGRHCEAGPDKEHQQQKPRLLQYYTPAVLLKRTQVCKHALATWCATNDDRQVQSKLADNMVNSHNTQHLITCQSCVATQGSAQLYNTLSGTPRSTCRQHTREQRHPTKRARWDGLKATTPPLNCWLRQYK